jgi:16S rRNA processing protein RimM
VALVDRERLTRIGVVVGAHGMRGALRVTQQTDDADYYTDRDWVYIDSEEGLRRFAVRAWNGGAGAWVLHLEGVGSRAEAERLKGGELLLEESRLRPLAEGEYFQHDLTGCRVVDEAGAPLGRVRSVMEGGGQMLLEVALEEVRESENPLLLPMTEAVILSVEIGERRIRVRPPPGLLELNR